jgi:hypothetical protein
LREAAMLKEQELKEQKQRQLYHQKKLERTKNLANLLSTLLSTFQKSKFRHSSQLLLSLKKKGQELDKHHTRSFTRRKDALRKILGKQSSRNRLKNEFFKNNKAVITRKSFRRWQAKSNLAL